MPATEQSQGGRTPHVRYAIVGAGFGGIGTAIRLERDLDEHDFLIFERSPEAGGCWWANQYPGAQCDIPSHLYSFSFEPNPNWTRSFAPQGVNGFPHGLIRQAVRKAGFFDGGVKTFLMLRHIKPTVV